MISGIYDIWQYSERRSAARSPVLVVNTTLAVAGDDKMNRHTVDLELESIVKSSYLFICERRKRPGEMETT